MVIDNNNPEFKTALDLIQYTNQSFYLTGKAGTGKSTFLRYIVENVSKNFVVVAPTGIAAINVGGVTIHSFFRFPLRPLLPEDEDITIFKDDSEKREIITAMDTLIIDEVSMARADIIDGIDYSLRKNGGNPDLPFGGKQVLFVGDIFQLEPVSIENSQEKAIIDEMYGSPYFYNAKVFQKIGFFTIELQKVYRQLDSTFVNLLDKIRINEISQEDFDKLNSRVISESELRKQDFVITLTPTNELANRVNIEKLNQLKTKLYKYSAEISDNFKASKYPTDPELILKEGAQVILIKNDIYGRWVNGTIGHICELSETEINVRLNDNTIHSIDKHTWENIKYQYNKNKRKIEQEVVGTFTQYPIKLAWAITIHKSQGLTFEKVIIDFGNGTFASGQAYVALSRAKTFEGLFLKRRLCASDVIIDEEVKRFAESYKDGVEDVEWKIKSWKSKYLESGNMSLPIFLKILKEELNKLNSEELVYFAWLCGVRTLPFLGVEGDFSFWQEKKRKQYLHAIFRALDLTFFYSQNKMNKAVESAYKISDFNISTNAAETTFAKVATYGDFSLAVQAAKEAALASITTAKLDALINYASSKCAEEAASKRLDGIHCFEGEENETIVYLNNNKYINSLTEYNQARKIAGTARKEEAYCAYTLYATKSSVQTAVSTIYDVMEASEMVNSDIFIVVKNAIETILAAVTTATEYAASYTNYSYRIDYNKEHSLVNEEINAFIKVYLDYKDMIELEKTGISNIYYSSGSYIPILTLPATCDSQECNQELFSEEQITKLINLSMKTAELAVNTASILGFNMKNIILDDIKAFQEKSFFRKNKSHKKYGKTWENFQKALTGENCLYWEYIYKWMEVDKWMKVDGSFRERKVKNDMTKERLAPIQGSPFLRRHDYALFEDYIQRQDSFPCDEEGELLVSVSKCMKEYYEIKFGKRRGTSDDTNDYVGDKEIFEEAVDVFLPLPPDGDEDLPF